MRVAPRSVIWVTAVSAMMASTVVASEATGQVQEMSPTVGQWHQQAVARNHLALMGEVNWRQGQLFTGNVLPD
eukprot:gene21376-22228_t